jgi:hypothetical protein
MKTTYSKDKINSFGGINFADHIIDKSSIYQTIDKELGKRGANAIYSYSDLIRSYLLLTLCGGDCAEDISENLHNELTQVKNFQVCSADTLLRMQKELTTPKEIYQSASGIHHEFNVNENLNALMLKLLIDCKQLNPDCKDYIFDYDNQFIPTEKYDSKRSYKKADGYFPGIATINNHPVYIENRNGNSNVKFKQEETLKTAYTLLREAGIKPKYSRMDCGSFDQEVIPVVEANSEFFFIRAQRCASLYEKIKQIDNWEEVEIGFKKYQVASIEYSPFGWKNKTYRYVISREKNNNGQVDVFTADDFKYRAIMTNELKMSDLAIILFYNARGESERLFDEMNNDFLWKKMPFSFLHENTVFLIIMAMCRNLFHFILNFVSKRLDFIKPTFRLKKFIFRFMVVPSKWITRGRQSILKLFSSKQYHLLLT